ncbi:hypothetical protein V5P93_000564 [Actinokineospora auranticolor]|uniref:Uncharacterized protein n=1 Tax=Actinokineospora auranticolor TaxID=155976 RepID=A0A2S6GZG5_9PSEU|nr:hypothetical protein [Actinokineospora auranticolor]PPK70556.1 hypothetical protein CLV40_102471 [Actinokineospora auranticolor]
MTPTALARLTPSNVPTELPPLAVTSRLGTIPSAFVHPTLSIAPAELPLLAAGGAVLDAVASASLPWGGLGSRHTIESTGGAA